MCAQALRLRWARSRPGGTRSCPSDGVADPPEYASTGRLQTALKPHWLKAVVVSVEGEVERKRTVDPVADFGIEQGDEQAPGGDVAVAQLLGLLVGEAEQLGHLLGSYGDFWCTASAGGGGVSC